MTAGRTNAEQLSQHWCTPPKYSNAVRRFFSGKIDLDPCSNQWSIIDAETEFSLPHQDGLLEDWNYPTIYVNPPYGADRDRGTTIRDWLRKCEESHRKYQSEILALVPVATNTRHWKFYVFGTATAVAFLYDTRLRFLVNGEDGGKGAPMSCAMVYWGPRYEDFENQFLQFGAVVDIRHLHSKNVGQGEQNLLFGTADLEDSEIA